MALGHRFAGPHLLELALTHRSLAQEERRHMLPGPVKRAAGPAHGYERLEFLGDRVLGLCVADMLLEAFPTEAEGPLARRHSQLVRRETLSEVASAIGLEAHIRLSAADAAARNNPSLLADVCEAVIGALYLDGGLPAAASFVRREWATRMKAVLAPPKDAKTGLQEWAQGQGKPLPVYEVVASDGPPHQPIFTIAVHVEGEAPAEGVAGSKRLAETAAAEALLARLSAGKSEGRP
jgi:ribonuclease-3